MEYNIDILVAGCNTTCMHCYVNGGAAPAMDIDDFKLCMDKLSPIFRKLKDNISFTLDNELFNHPKAVEILEYIEKNCFKNYYHHGSTTGIAFLNHPKQKEVLHILKKNNWTVVSFAIHGGYLTHNRIVNNEKGLESIIKASHIFKNNGFDVWISLMITKELIKDLSKVSALLDEIAYDDILPVIPDFYPTSRLLKYQSMRCNENEYDKILEFLEKRNVSTQDLRTSIHLYNEHAVMENQNILETKMKEKLSSNQTAFFHIDNKLDFYLGNTGSALKYFGNIRDLSSDDILKHILSASDNYYETSSIHYNDILSAIKNKKLKRSKENYVYPSEIAAILAMMVAVF